MKKLILATLVSFFTFSAMAVDSASLTLQGSIPASVSVSVASTNGNTALDLTQTTDQEVATIQENSNTLNGYTITLTSAGAGNLVHETIGGSQVPYTVKYDGLPFDLSTPQEVKDATTSGVVSDTSAFNVVYNAQNPATLPQGNYTDTVTITITEK